MVMAVWLADGGSVFLLILKAGNQPTREKRNQYANFFTLKENYFLVKVFPAAVFFSVSTSGTARFNT
jgi:hypothetical protein